MDDLRLYKPKEAAEKLGIHLKTLANLRSARAGPPWLKIPGVGIRYEHERLKAWVLGQPQGGQMIRPATRRAGRPHKLVM